MAYNVNFILQPTFNVGPFDITGTTYDGMKSVVASGVLKSELLGEGMTFSIDDNITKFDIGSKGTICTDTTVILPFPQIRIFQSESFYGALFQLNTLSCGPETLYDYSFIGGAPIYITPYSDSYSTHTSTTGTSVYLNVDFTVISGVSTNYRIYCFDGVTTSQSRVFESTEYDAYGTFTINSQWAKQIIISIYPIT